jgi:RimJ/RimL family protein N-acetyltransferase
VSELRSDSSFLIETQRLLLRLPQREDFDAYADFMSDAEAAEFIGGQQARAEAWRGFLQIVGAWYLQGFSMFSVIEKETGEWVGRIGPWMPEGWPGTEVGWGIVRSRWNRGYATEAATASIDWAFAELGWTEVVHVIAPDNIASQAVARKLGSRNRGAGHLPAPLESMTIDVWGQTRAEWQATRAPMKVNRIPRRP